MKENGNAKKEMSFQRRNSFLKSSKGQPRSIARPRRVTSYLLTSYSHEVISHNHLQQHREAWEQDVSSAEPTLVTTDMQHVFGKRERTRKM